MNDIITIKIFFGIFLSIGTLVIFFIDFKFFYKYLIQEKRCLKRTKGIIKKYTLASRGGENISIHLPIVFYEVDGKQYKVVGPEYKLYKITSVTNPISKNNILEYYEDKKQNLVIKHKSNAFVGIYKNPIQEMYPLNSEIDVFYDEKNPKLSYVLRYCNRKFLFWIGFVGAMFTLIMDIYVLFIL